MQNQKVYIPLHKRTKEKIYSTVKGLSPMEMTSNHDIFYDILIISDGNVEKKWKECLELGVYAF